MEKLDYASPETIRDATQYSAVASGAALAAWFAVLTAFVVGTFWPAILFPFLSLFALWFGILGRRKAGPEPSASRSRATAALWLGGIQLALFGLVLLFMPSMGRAREPAKRIKCASNLRQIGYGIQFYVNDHGGRFPSSFDDLLLHAELPSEVLVCPSSDHERATGPTTQAMVANFRADPRYCSYVYVGAGLTTTTATAAHVLAYERAGNHSRYGMNVLYGDGTVNWLDAKEAAYLLAELNAGRNPPRPLPSAATVPVGG